MKKDLQHRKLAVAVGRVYCTVALVAAEEGATRSVMPREVKRTRFYSMIRTVIA